MNIPGSMGWVAFDCDRGIVGYTLVRPIIMNEGSEIGMNMAPLYAENNQAAGVLMKIAADLLMKRSQQQHSYLFMPEMRITARMHQRYLTKWKPNTYLSRPECTQKEPQ